MIDIDENFHFIDFDFLGNEKWYSHEGTLLYLPAYYLEMFIKYSDKWNFDDLDDLIYY